MATQISVSDETLKPIDQYAKKYDLQRPEALGRMIGVAVSRLNALARYANKGNGAAAPAKKKVAKKTATKAKGPIARKAAKAKE